MLVKIILVCLSFLAAIYQGFEKLWKKENKPSIADYIFFFVLLGIAGLTGFSIWEDNETNKQEAIEKRQQEIADRDTLKARIERGIDSGNRNTYDTLAMAFANQGINLDSLKQGIRSIKQDTLKKFPTPIPDVDFCYPGLQMTEHTPEKILFNVFFCSKEATALEVNISLYAVVQLMSGKFAKLQPAVFADGMTKIQKDVTIQMAYGFKRQVDADSFKIIYVVAKGFCKGQNTETKYPIYSIVSYRIQEQTFSLLNKADLIDVERYLEPK